LKRITASIERKNNYDEGKLKLSGKNNVFSL